MRRVGPGSRPEPCSPRRSARFPRRARLQRPPEFDRVFACSKRSGDEGFVVLARRNAAGIPRLGLVVARRRVRKATRRNCLKRLVRESFRQNQGRLTGLDIIVVARSGSNRLGPPALRAALEAHWRVLAKHADRPDIAH